MYSKVFGNVLCWECSFQVPCGHLYVTRTWLSKRLYQYVVNLPRCMSKISQIALWRPYYMNEISIVHLFLHYAAVLHEWNIDRTPFLALCGLITWMKYRSYTFSCTMRPNYMNEISIVYLFLHYAAVITWTKYRSYTFSCTLTAVITWMKYRSYTFSCTMTAVLHEWNIDCTPFLALCGHITWMKYRLYTFSCTMRPYYMNEISIVHLFLHYAAILHEWNIDCTPFLALCGRITWMKYRSYTFSCTMRPYYMNEISIVHLFLHYDGHNYMNEISIVHLFLHYDGRITWMKYRSYTFSC